MSDPTLLYTGVCCFLLMLVGLALTILEFRKMSASRVKPAKTKRFAARPRAVASFRNRAPVECEGDA